ncbi:hypothetical protein [Peterkaempfera sp. SMS 1(5)a]|uniref:hypothetical protein n=1 Tax=Peterkaempfera podocarpi TaxID=3232308 RepID=UPI00366F1290
MSARPRTSVGIVVAVTAIVSALTWAGAEVPAQAAGTPWLKCPSGDPPAYSTGYTRVVLTNAEFRFQACRTPGGSLTRTKLSYVKRKGLPVDIALAWEWVTRDGKETRIPDEPNGGDPFFHRIAAGQTHTVDFSFKAAGADGRRPAPRFSCIQGVLQLASAGAPAKTYLTPRACF